MISEICAELQNYFLRDYDNPNQHIHAGEFVIADGEMQNLPFLKKGQYFRIVGSTFNDGVWRYGDVTTKLTDETFDGSVWAMFVPPDFVKLAQKIKEWTVNNANAINSPYQSESFGGYSYTKAIANTGKLATDWQTHFESQLKRWRRHSVL